MLQGIGDLPRILPIFLTALETHALEAFDVAAIDYLVKPVAQERFSQAIQRARERLRGFTPASGPTYTRRLLLERLRLAYMLPVDCIEWIGADRNYARLFSKGEFVLRMTMDRLQQQLDPAVFARVSRSSIARLDAIEEFRIQADGSYLARLKIGAMYPIQRHSGNQASEPLSMLSCC